MQLDIETLTLAGAFVAVTTGLFLAFTGWRYRNLSTTGVLGLAAVVASFGMALFAEQQQYSLAFFFVTAAGSMTWIAMARFTERRPPLAMLAAAAVAWLAISLWPFDMSPGSKLAMHQFVLAFVVLGAALELRHARGEGLRALWPMIVLVAAHGTIFLFGGLGSLFASSQGAALSPDMFWPIYFEVIVYTIGAAVIFMALVTERELSLERAAARVDWLTGLFNRGAFVEAAQDALALSIAAREPVSAILFDLDRFKAINDSFGHAAGDAVLQRFAAVAGRHLRRSDIIGRVGGEEFAVVLPRTDPQTATALAQRVRESFDEDCRWIDGRAIGATLSAGVAVARSGFSFDDLISAADRALYVSKQDGRNRVELYDERQEKREGVLVRFA